MSTFVKKQERESFDAMLRRFTRMVVGSKVITEAKERQFFKKETTRRARRSSAVRREKIRAQKQKELY
ncbi:30S ribosomal protein S21 [candidate division Kazan bacterium RIFCSPHIGHO2_01_FULL_44_14]|uniref:Small ribosomal subunit protein bS21 n=1 Tax=candidate division Kazan bacterium RIFCSPLOWO2_01_FULL_45_19 TaxID=1798538 RepID=A0A1F4NQP9_UNCK3|nr:MAG: 30S ribosomal protein S21 [candidate division Kazan bacterium RIFCSPLOWO2_01_FULL_45_19]OGB78039.1 MAG: 30S ribosomal protein S21 [candidate division Kazan bacterium RIFCSPHIGHO2_01_FULL_44_14]